MNRKPLKIKASIAIQASADGSKMPTVAITLYTGDQMWLAGYDVPVVVDLAGIITDGGSSIPILRDHDAGRVLGHVHKVSTDDGSLRVVGVLSGAGPDADEVREAFANGMPWQASMGADVVEGEDVGDGQNVEVNGRIFTGPLLVARRVQLVEASIVAIGADRNTAAKIAAKKLKGESKMTFSEWLVSLGIEEAKLSEAQVAELAKAYDLSYGTPPVEATTKEEPEMAAGDGPAKEDETITAHRRRMSAELSRQAAVAKIAAAHPEIAAKAVAEGWTADRTELAVLRATRPTQIAASNGRGNGSPRKLAVVQAALALNLGLRPQTIAAQFEPAERENIMHEATQRDNRNHSLHSLMDMTIEASGGHYSGSRRSASFIQATRESMAKLKAAGFTTFSLPGILGNLANTALIDGYTAVNVTWPQICATRSHNNFQVHTRYRLDATGAIRKVGKDGELKHMGMTEAEYTLQLDTYGALLALTRQDLIDDNLGAFGELPRQMGRLTALRQEEAVYTLLLSNPGSFFSTGNGNYFEGSTSALSIDSLTTAKKLFLNMLDSNGKPVIEIPRILLVPSALADVAEVLMAERAIIDGTATTKQPARNPHAGSLSIVTSPYLDNTGIRNEAGAAISGQSATAFYVLADPASRAALAMAGLNGNTSPIIERNEAPFNVLGEEFRVYVDFAAGVEDSTAAVKSKGAA